MNDDKRLTGDEILAAELDDWRLVLGKLVSRFETGSFSRGTDFIVEITKAAEEANHHPDVDLRYPHVTIALLSHDVGAVTGRDTNLAARISEIASLAGIAAGTAPDVLELALDTPDHEPLVPFYEALLGYTSEQSDDVRDPAGRAPNLWFQQTDSDNADRQRWHLDVSVPHDSAEQRLTEVLAAGGTLVDDSAAPAFWVVADADGNRSCICTRLNR